MTIDEAIKHCEEVVEKNEQAKKDGNLWIDTEYEDCCADHRQLADWLRELKELKKLKAADVQPIDKDNTHIIYIGRKAYLAENTIMEFMKKMDIIRDSLAHIENYFDTYAETIRQINACVGRCTDITEVKYFIDRIKENSGYD